MDNSDLIERILTYNGAVNTGSFDIAAVSQLKDLQQIAPSYLQWYNNLEYRKHMIKDFLLNLDNISKVKYDDEYTKTIYRGADVIMKSIVNELAKLKTNFSGRLVKMGSAYNHMKIDKPDEFDFTFEIRIEKILNEKAKITAVRVDNIRVNIYVEFEGEQPDISEFDWYGCPSNQGLENRLSMNGSKDAEYYKGALRRHGDAYILNTDAVAIELFNTLDSVVANLELPANWYHGGYNLPNYSGLRLNLPAYLIQFAYHPPDKQTPLVVSFDFAPVFKLPENFRYKSMDVVDEYLLYYGYVHSTCQRLGSGTFKGGHFNFAEEEWLKTYDSNSIPKVVIRVCKALHNMVKLTTPKYLKRSVAESIAEHRKNKDGFKTRQHGIASNDFMMNEANDSKCIDQIPSQSDFATFADVNENIGGHDYIPSYIFKRIVMTFMVLDEQKGREWTKEDVPDLVVCVFMIINDIIMSVNQATEVVAFVKKTGVNTNMYVMRPRSKIYKNNENRDNSLTKEVLEIPLEHLRVHDIIHAPSDSTLPRPQHEMKSYILLHETIKQGKCEGLTNLFVRSQFCHEGKKLGLDDRIERVIELLKYVFDGKPNASISIKKRRVIDEDDISHELDKIFITRAELLSLMTDDKQ